MSHRARRLAVLVALLVFPAAVEAGNGAPSGAHYNLNIIGLTNCSGDDLTGSNRHVIQVLLNFNDGNQNGQQASTLDKKNKIQLSEGDFQVLDGNACDGDGARFQLPANPYTCPAEDPECLNTDPTFQEYTVYARALGSPKNNPTSSLTTCAVDAGVDETFDTADDILVCSTESAVFVREKGGSKFENVTKKLTTLCLDTDLNTTCDTRVGIFDDDLQGYFWDYDNNGVRLVQLRFVPIPD